MPGIEQTCSADIEELTRLLATQLESRVGSLDALFDPALIVVPNATIETYLKQEIASRLKVTPNLEFRLLRSFLRDCLPETSGPVIGREELHHILVDLLLDPDQPWLRALPELHGYLTAVADPDARHRRVYQLSGELSRLFMEYSFSRSPSLHGCDLGYEPIIERWRRLGPDGPRHLDGVERWQQVLWWKIFGSDSDRGPSRIMTLPDAFLEVSPEDLRAPESFHLFGFAYLARHFLEAIELISHRSRVHVYTLRPASEDPAEAELLQLWGHASRDHTAQWEEIHDSTNPPAATSGRLLPKEPIRFLNAASIPREVESIAEQIWTVLHDHHSRGEALPSIAVLIAGADQHAYQAHIESVFSRPPQIPYTMSQMPRTSRSGILDAARHLLSLPFGDFHRDELLRLLIHPNLAGRGAVDLDEWKRWCADLTIIAGADHEDYRDTYLDEAHPDVQSLPRDLYNWHQGFRRLILGAFLPCDDDEPVEIDGHPYLPLDIGSAATSSAARFYRLASSLIEDARWLRGQHHTVADWADLIADYLETYLTPRADTDDDPLLYVTLLRLCGRLAEESARKPVPYRIFYEHLRQKIDDLTATGRASLTGGVIVSTALALRAVPFDYIFVVGLGAGQFPNPELRDPLDLRLPPHDEPRQGDLSPTERDRYTFLEALIAARERATLSWVGREATTGEHLEPSSVVTQLRHVLGDRCEEIATPLRAFDAANALQSPYHETRQLARLSAMKEEITQGNRGALRLPSLKDLRSALRHEPHTLAALRRDLKLRPAPLEDVRSTSSTAIEKPRTLRISLAALRKFLESPLQGAARLQLNLYSEDDDRAIEHTPITSTSLQKAILLKELIRATLLSESPGQTDFDTLFDDLGSRALLKGQLPSGYFYPWDRDSHRTSFNDWLTFIEDKLKLPLHGYSFVGVGVDGSSEHLTLPPLQFELSPQETNLPEHLQIELWGSTNLWTSHFRDILTFANKSNLDGVDKKDRTRDRYFLRTFVDHMAVAASGFGLPVKVNHHLVNTKTNSGEDVQMRFTRSHPTPPSEKARQYLRDLLVTIFAETHDYSLPIELVRSAVIHGEECPTPQAIHSAVEEEREDILSDSYKKFRDQFGPITDYHRFSVPEASRLIDILETRFPHLWRGDR